MEKDIELEIDLGEIFRLLWSKALLLILTAVLAAAMVFSYTWFCVSPMYTASVSLYVYSNNRSGTSVSTSDLNASKTLVDTYLVILESNSLLTQVSDQLSTPVSASAIRSMMSASAINDTEAFRVSIRSSDPALAQEIANCLADVAPAELLRVVKGGDAEVIDYAELPTGYDWPIVRNTAVGALVGFLLAAAYVILRHLLDTTIHTEEDLTKTFSLPVLGNIPFILESSSSDGKESRS